MSESNKESQCDKKTKIDFKKQRDQLGQRLGEKLEHLSHQTSKFGSRISAGTQTTYSSLRRHTLATFAEDVESIRENSNLLNLTAQAKFPSGMLESSLLGLAGAGFLETETQLARLTRPIMDGNGGFPEEVLKMMFGKDKVREISVWMDTVPGASGAGRYAHRLQHGHDLDALVKLIKNHNVAGGLEWFNHVFLRDFWTPHGIPWLPKGSGSAYSWLTAHGVKSSVALGILSVNVWQVVGLYTSIRYLSRVHDFVVEAIKTKEQKKLWEQALKYEELHDFTAANEYYDKLSATDPRSSSFKLGLAVQSMNQAKRSEELAQNHLFRSFVFANAAVDTIRSDMATMSMPGGLEINQRGLAVVLMVASTVGAPDKEMWRNSISGRISSGVHNFVESANRLKSRPVAKPFSAIANELLAMNLLQAAPGLAPTAIHQGTLHRRISESLIEMEHLPGPKGEFARQLLAGFQTRYPLIENQPSS